MKIEVEKRVPEPTTLEEFADVNDLTMKVIDYGNGRVCASFAGAEVKQGSCLASVYGQAATQEAAIANYAKQISGEILAINAFHLDRREVRVPRFKMEKSE